ATSRAIESLEPDRISRDQACGRNAINGLLTAARHHGLTARTGDLRSSGDTAGSREEVVGYGAYIFDPAPPGLTDPLKRQLLHVARLSIEHGLSHGTALRLEPGDFPSELREKGAAFVTLEVRGEL